MARIRSVKPELRTSLTAAQWPREVRYFWVLLWGYLDDHGYGIDEPRLIKPDCFPLDDDLTPDDIDKWLDIFVQSVSLCRFTAPDGRRYLHAVNWAEHQRPQHPAVPKLPVCPRDSHETLMNPSHDSLMNPSHDSLMSLSGDSHETILRTDAAADISAGQTPSRESHETLSDSAETLTPEQVVGAGSREQGGVAREARTRAAATLLGNALLDEHRRQVRPPLPRDVARRTGEQIDSLLGDPEITPDEIRAGLAKMRANPKLGPGVLPSLVHEVRQERAHPGLASRGSARRGHRPYQNPADDSVYEEPI